VMLLAPEGIFVFLGDRLGRLFKRSGTIAREQEDTGL